MRSIAVTALMIFASIAAAQQPATLNSAPISAPMAITAMTTDWQDAARGVTVPVKMYFPKEAKEPLPVIIFSHGLGGSRETYARWGEYWAAQGYVVIHPTHVGSDASLITGEGAETRTRGTGREGIAALREGVLARLATGISAESAQRRTKDVSFIIDQMEKINAGGLANADAAMAGLKGRVDVKHIGMAGHSFGAQTTLAISGQTMGLPNRPISQADPRVTAAIAMSPQPPIFGNPKTAFASIKIPILHLTGTLDSSPPILGNVQPAQRRIPFDNCPGPDAFLVIFKDATHMTFTPRSNNPLAARAHELLAGPETLPPAEVEKVHQVIEQSSTAFWNAYLKNDAKAKEWLRGDFGKTLGAAGTLEMKK